jgi:hypothetical protein
MNNFELGVAGQINVMTQSIDELDKASVAVKHDIGDFSAITHFATDAQCKARAEAINADLKSSKEQTHGFADHLEGYLARTEAVEAGFHDHVVNASNKVEAEFSEVKAVIQGAHDAAASTADRAISTSHLANAARIDIQLRQNSLRATAIEAEQIGIKSDLAESQQGTAMSADRLQAAVQNMYAAAVAATTLQSTATVGDACHCPCVEALNKRGEEGFGPTNVEMEAGEQPDSSKSKNE